VHKDVPVLYGKSSVFDAGGRCGFYVRREVAGDLSGDSSGPLVDPFFFFGMANTRALRSPELAMSQPQAEHCNFGPHGGCSVYSM